MNMNFIRKLPIPKEIKAQYPIPTELMIHTNCLPLRHPHSNIDDGSVECMDAYMLAHPIQTSSSQPNTSHQSIVFARLLFLYPPAVLISLPLLYAVGQRYVYRRADKGSYAVQ